MLGFKHSKTDDLVVSLVIGFVVTTRAVVYAEHTFFGKPISILNLHLVKLNFTSNI